MGIELHGKYTVDDLELSWIDEVIESGNWNHVSDYAAKCRYEVLERKGLVLMQFHPKFVKESEMFQKISYFVLMQTIGRVVSGIRGRIFAVKAQNAESDHKNTSNKGGMRNFSFKGLGKATKKSNASVFAEVMAKKRAEKSASRASSRRGSIVTADDSTSNINENEETEKKQPSVLSNLLKQAANNSSIIKIEPIKSEATGSAMSKKSNNTLFSVTNDLCGWHTDGCNVKHVYDTVNLYCLQNGIGGELFVSNFCNVWEHLKIDLPYFMLTEFLRPLPRDILENGNANGVGKKDPQMKFLRDKEFLKIGAHYNSFPIYYFKLPIFTSGGHMTVRYMRHWIETGHGLAGMQIPPFLRVAMDVLDKQLDNAAALGVVMQPGQAVVVNNRLLAHMRNGFKNIPGKPRHQVRTW